MPDADDDARLLAAEHIEAKLLLALTRLQAKILATLAVIQNVGIAAVLRLVWLIILLTFG